MKLIYVLLLLLFTVPAFAKQPIRVADIGVMGLASHDLFQWNSRTRENEENGRFDLSTIFDYADGTKIHQGGNPKNASNTAVYSVTQSLVSYYSGKKATLLMSRKVTEEQAHIIARQQTVTFFIGMVKESYERFTNSRFPDYALAQNVNDDEQAVMRALHDILPGKIIVNRNLTQEVLVVTDYKLAMTQLSASEMMQMVKFFDGKYDEEYLHVVVPGFPDFQIINLQEIDQKFIAEQTNYNLAHMLMELHFYGKFPFFGNLVDFTSFGFHLENLFAKGICNKYVDGSPNPWNSIEIDCY
ncbi:hypothetical protein [Pseudoalteromonas luteoviolacea]|uniref:Uncharacterized protein n=1 Tax=Pseudoalteromonas luteoviolacea S4054 TaxID=1129367 RepID=A0A0F6A599_9GAMM|nr:hypothetical protein [Pseudoalteromonas luteoviolacea]AOT07563.1 hypothetical protein S4054249_06790 [Pseudoalteromonas luteoviolacea]AOT12479.1 hypothetical protein S40542_06790 [Pseudoalteromonas luteoviolacea]AOT17393.1 hypothetical protein S4054_06790 [Pseudoalteromonas luteoviolacea]KKE81298.1 hypothetical protein N479_22445 [Pseudoalteromonas luteoviolacea S4054]KZN70693.1 hypothetical protein N481_20990 [Pseudoalteromonas luteoviolacea S4047-1]